MDTDFRRQRSGDLRFSRSRSAGLAEFSGCETRRDGRAGAVVAAATIAGSTPPLRRFRMASAHCRKWPRARTPKQQTKAVPFSLHAVGGKSGMSFRCFTGLRCRRAMRPLPLVTVHLLVRGRGAQSQGALDIASASSEVPLRKFARKADEGWVAVGGRDGNAPPDGASQTRRPRPGGKRRSRRSSLRSSAGFATQPCRSRGVRRGGRCGPHGCGS